jgi:hypothetical protein
MSKKYSPQEIKPVLQALAQTGAVVIGGQAINLWAEHYQTDSAPWNELRPYTSFDLDVLGSRTDVLECSQALAAEAFFPAPSENTVNSGKVVAQIEGRPFEIDFLHSPNGLSAAEVLEMARTIRFEDVQINILHPLHCVESKTVNLVTLSQDGGDRQDLKHLRLAIAILRQHFTKLTLDGGNEQVLLRWTHRLRTDANHELGIKVTIQHRIRFQEAIPAELWQSRGGPLRDFVERELEDWKKENSQKVADFLELENWLKSLNEKSRSPTKQ